MRPVAKTLLLAAIASGIGLPQAAGPDTERRTGYVHDTSRDPFLMPADGKPFGDPFPVCWDGVWHLYSMSADARRVLHFTSTDLVRWAEHEPAMEGRGIATGSVVRHQGRYYLFYTDAEPQTIRLVVSGNPWKFDFTKSRLAAEADGKTYRKGWFRDAHVFYNGDERLWWMLVESRSPEVCIGLFKSKDLLTWAPAAPIFQDKARQYGSCPQLFRNGRRWYLALQDLGNWHYTAPAPYGPWENRGQYLSVVVEAASRFADDGRRTIGWGWLCDWPAKPEVKILSYGGPLSAARELVFHKDGSIGVRPVPEVIAAIRRSADNKDLAACARPLSGEWRIESRHKTLRSTGAGGGTVLFDLPGGNPNYYLEAGLELGTGASASFVVRSTAGLDSGFGLALQPARQTIALCRLKSKHDRELLNDKRCVFAAANHETGIQIFVSGSYIEAFVDGRVSLSARVAERTASQIGITIEGGPARIRRPLLHYFREKPGA